MYTYIFTYLHTNIQTNPQIYMCVRIEYSVQLKPPHLTGTLKNKLL